VCIIRRLAARLSWPSGFDSPPPPPSPNPNHEQLRDPAGPRLQAVRPQRPPQERLPHHLELQAVARLAGKNSISRTLHTLPLENYVRRRLIPISRFDKKKMLSVADDFYDRIIKYIFYHPKFITTRRASVNLKIVAEAKNLKFFCVHNFIDHKKSYFFEPIHRRQYFCEHWICPNSYLC